MQLPVLGEHVLRRASPRGRLFLGTFHPTGDDEADLPKILEFYRGLKGGNPDNLSLPLRNL